MKIKERQERLKRKGGTRIVVGQGGEVGIAVAGAQVSDMRVDGSCFLPVRRRLGRERVVAREVYVGQHHHETQQEHEPPGPAASSCVGQRQGHSLQFNGTILRGESVSTFPDVPRPVE